MIDARTLLLALTIGNIALAATMLGYVRADRDNLPLRLWRWARLVQAGGHVLIWLKPLLSFSGLGMLGGTLLLAGALLDVTAYLRFLGVQRWRWRIYPLGGAGLLAYYGAWAAGAEPAQTGMLLTSVLALLACVMAYALLSQRKASPLQRLIGFNDLLFALVLVVRVGLLASGTLSAPQVQTVQGLVYLCAFVLMIVNGFGFLLLCKEKDDEALARLATIDPLTGLLNRRAFFERAAIARNLAERAELPVAVLMLDIDHFKRLNDGHGHGAGDEALRAFAALATAALREQDLLGRLGGEEFAVLLPGADSRGAQRAAERLRAAMADALLRFDGEPCTLTVSIGLTVVAAGEPLHLALARADRALYAAKRSGRNCVRTWTGEAHAETSALQDRARTAAQHGGLPVAQVDGSIQVR
jgi:diguanylate cyclase (GGDEF)-like protein